MKNPMEIFKDFELRIDYRVTECLEPPFLVYTSKGSNNLNAENKVYYSQYNYVIEYYFNKKDEELEKRIEERLNENEIVWSKSGDIFFEEEGVSLIYYYI